MIYDLTFIGAGPSTFTAVLYLIEKKYNGKICIVEKGKSLDTRQPNEIVSGVGGCGTYSDGKLSSSYKSIGGYIPWLSEEDFNKYEEKIINYYKKFTSGNPENIKWATTTNFDTSPSSLKWDVHKTLHLGTEVTRNIFYNIEKYITSQPNIDLITETEVLNVFRDKVKGEFTLALTNSKAITTKNVVVATGQKNKLPGLLMKLYNLSTTPSAFQIGVRVEDTMNPQYEEIIKANYDFKFVKEYSYKNGIKVRVRTFCCNSGNAHTCAEKNSEGFTCFNGHAFKTSDPNNHTVNYGIMCEVEGTDKFDTKDKQINLMKEINASDMWKFNNFDIDGSVEPKCKLLGGLTAIEKYYPKEVIKSIKDFIQELNKVVDLSNAHYLYPEVKLNEGRKPLLTNGWETNVKGLYMIGDATSWTRGILKSSISGIQFAGEFLVKNEL